MDPSHTSMRDAMRAYLAQGYLVRVTLDATVAGVEVPERLATATSLVLEYGAAHRVAVPILDFDVGDGGVRATLSFDGLPRATFVPWSAVRRLVTHGVPLASAEDAFRCALCAKRRTEVKQVVAGEAGSVCEACTALAIGAFESQTQPGHGFPHVLAAICDVLAVLPAFTPFARTAPLLRGARVIADGDAAVLRDLIPLARRLWHDGIALELDAMLPAASRTFGDRVERVVALLRLGRYADAVGELATTDESSLADHDRVVLCVDRAAAAAGLGGAALDDAERAVAAADALVATLAAIPAHAGVVGLRSPLACARIRVALARGAPERAEPYAAHLAAEDCECALVGGDLDAALGRRDPAVAHWTRALGLAHPESVLADWARARLR